MRHFIIVKLKDSSKRRELIAPITELFSASYEIDGVSQVSVHECCTPFENRYDIMIEMVMEERALPVYNDSEMHRTWKRVYGELIEKKAIFGAET